MSQRVTVYLPDGRTVRTINPDMVINTLGGSLTPPATATQQNTQRATAQTTADPKASSTTMVRNQAGPVVNTATPQQPTQQPTQQASPQTQGYKSYAVLPDGSVTDVYIQDGRTFLPNGQRVPIGATVQTQGGIYQMTPQGGVKVDAHNTLYTAQQQQPQQQMTSQDAYAQMLEALTDQINQYQAQQQAIQQQAAAQARAQQQYLDWATSPEVYQEILERVLGMHEPLTEANKAAIAQQVADARRQADIDAERRGMFRSGAAMDQHRQIGQMGDEAIARMLAEMQAQAVDHTQRYQDRMMQRAQMEGDWARLDRQLDQRDLQSYMDTLLSGTRLGLEGRDSDREYDLRRGQQEHQQALDWAKIDLSRDELTERARQFDARLAEDQRTSLSAAQQMDMFAKEMGHKWASLDVQSKIASTDAMIRKAQLDLQERKFATEEELIQQQNRLEEFEILRDAYNFIYYEGILNDVPKEDLLILIEPYREVNPSIYEEIRKTIEEQYKDRRTGGGFNINEFRPNIRYEGPGMGLPSHSFQ